MKTQERERRTRRGIVMMALMGCAAMAGVALGGPEDAQVVHGTAAIEQSGAITNITTSQQAIINYSQFNIGAGETVNFVQPNAQSRVLNRINGLQPTQIAGTLNANGTVYFINPQGVRFHNGAVVNVGGIYAAAGTMSDADFLAGMDRFDQLYGTVTNEGLIRAGEVGLIGGKVINSGRIEIADGGLLTMSAGEEVIIARHGSRVTVEVNPSNLQEAEDAASGVTLGAGDMVSLAMAATAPSDPDAGSVTYGGEVEAGVGSGIHLTGADILIDTNYSSIDHLTADATSSITFDVAGTAVETDEYQEYTVTGGGPIVLKQDTTLTGTRVTFNGNVVSETGASASLTVNGSADFNGTVGTDAAGEALRSLDIDGTTNIAGGAIRTTTRQDYRGITNFLDDATLETGGDGGVVRFYQSVSDSSADAKGVGVGADVVITSPRTYFDLRVSTTPTMPGRIIGSLRVNGETVFNNWGQFTVLDPSRITTVRDQIYNGPVIITENVHMKSFTGDIRFLSTLDAVPSGMAGSMGFELPALNGGVSSAGLTAHALEGNVQFGGNVGVTYGGRYQTGGNLDYLIAVADPTTGKMITFGPDSSGMWPGDTTMVGVYGDVLLNPSLADLTDRGRTPIDGEHVTLGFIPLIATMEHRGDTLTIESMDGAIIMGQNNKFTSLGALSLVAYDEVKVGDLNAFDSIRVSSTGDIILRTRPASNLYDFQGNTSGPASEDTNLDLVTNGAVDFNLAPIFENPGGVVFIGSALGAAADINGTLGAATFITQSRGLNEFSLASATGGVPANQTLDMTPFEGGGDVQAFVLAGPLPFNDRVIREPLLAPADQAFLAQLLVTTTRGLQVNETVTGMDRIRVYNDGGGRALTANTNAPGSTLAINRMRRASAEEAIAVMRSIRFGDGGATASGQDHAAMLRDSINAAWAAYQRSDSNVNFVRYLAESEEHRAVYGRVMEIADLLTRMERTGVTDLEYAVFVNASLTPLTPEGLSTDRFHEMLTGRPLVEPAGGETASNRN